jgi:hypothetical protein
VKHHIGKEVAFYVEFSSAYVHSHVLSFFPLSLFYLYPLGSKEIGLEVNSDKTKYMAKSRDQTSGRSHSMKTDNSYFEKVEEFRCLGTALTNQNYI